MPMTGNQLQSFLETNLAAGAQPLVVAIIDYGDGTDEHPATTRYYNVEFTSTDTPPVVPDGTLVLYLGAELTV